MWISNRGNSRQSDLQFSQGQHKVWHTLYRDVEHIRYYWGYGSSLVVLTEDAVGIVDLLALR